MSELKPCPFCGKENTVAGSTERMILGWWYACEDCFENRKGGVYEDRWNTRPIEDALNARIAALEAEIRNWQDCYCEFETIAPDGNLKISVLDLYNRLTELNARIAELEAENAALKAEPKPLEYWSDEKKQTYADNEGRSAKRSEE